MSNDQQSVMFYSAVAGAVATIGSGITYDAGLMGSCVALGAIAVCCLLALIGVYLEPSTPPKP